MSPIPSLRLRNISSSSRIHDESDHTNPTHQSSSSSRIQVRSRSSYTNPISSVRLDSTFCFRFQLPAWTEIKFYSWWFDSKIQESIDTTTTSSAQKFGPALHRPSPTTYPENSTNPCAELVEAESLVICEEITWRPVFIGRLGTV